MSHWGLGRRYHDGYSDRRPRPASARAVRGGPAPTPYLSLRDCLSPKLGARFIGIVHRGVRPRSVLADSYGLRPRELHASAEAHTAAVADDGCRRIMPPLSHASTARPPPATNRKVLPPIWGKDSREATDRGVGEQRVGRHVDGTEGLRTTAQGLGQWGAPDGGSPCVRLHPPARRAHRTGAYSRNRLRTRHVVVA